MKPHVRRSVAFIAGKALSGSGGSSVYDYGESAYFNFSGTVDAPSVSVFDYEKGCHITGQLPSLYHFGESHHIQLVLEEDRFRGYDYGSGNHFSGTVNGRRVSLYDYEVGQYFSYTV